MLQISPTAQVLEKPEMSQDDDVPPAPSCQHLFIKAEAWAFVTHLQTTAQCCLSACCKANDFTKYFTKYTPDKAQSIFAVTEGQRDNQAWHQMCEGIVTATKIHPVCNHLKTLQTKPDADPSKLVYQTIDPQPSVTSSTKQQEGADYICVYSPSFYLYVSHKIANIII